MKVKELVAELLELDQEVMVVVDGYEGGYSDPNVGNVELTLNVNKEYYYGNHEEGGDVKAICISRD